jgi:ferredoxin
MRITVDIDRCVGGGQCVLSAPELFDQSDEDGTAVLLRQPLPEDEDEARQAARVCPASAIHLNDS